MDIISFLIILVGAVLGSVITGYMIFAIFFRDLNIVRGARNYTEREVQREVERVIDKRYNDPNSERELE